MTAVQVCSETRCDVIGLQQTREEEGCITQGEYVIIRGGARVGTRGKKGLHEKGLAVKRELWDG